MKYKIITNNEFLESFPEIHYFINKHYPIGLKKDSEKYNTYSGIKKLNKKIYDNIVNSNIHDEKWINGFIDKLKSKLDMDNIFSTTAGLVPNLSGVIKIKETLNNVTELHFHKSLINNYFTIEILEIDKFKEITHPILGKKMTIGISSITTSPFGEYEDLFLKVYNSINEQFNESKFIPYIFDLIRIKGLEVPYKNDLDVTISGALFQKYSTYDNSVSLIGDINYKIDQLK